MYHCGVRPCQLTWLPSNRHKSRRPHIYNCMGCDILDQRKKTGYQDYSNYANKKVNRDKVNTK